MLCPLFISVSAFCRYNYSNTKHRLMYFHSLGHCLTQERSPVCNQEETQTRPCAGGRARRLVYDPRCSEAQRNVRAGSESSFGVCARSINDVAPSAFLNTLKLLLLLLLLLTSDQCQVARTLAALSKINKNRHKLRKFQKLFNHVSELFLYSEVWKTYLFSLMSSEVLIFVQSCSSFTYTCCFFFVVDFIHVFIYSCLDKEMKPENANFLKMMYSLKHLTNQKKIN